MKFWKEREKNLVKPRQTGLGKKSCRVERTRGGKTVCVQGTGLKLPSPKKKEFPSNRGKGVRNEGKQPARH